ncbi:Hsp20/alpha crystallin family protein [Halostagnicola sp. A-GB9-2]|uniref:DUF7127 family protein n=1 Tax=Halostagnicola sp. A-GB9-2 TaxID=3048066 RepID=UPI0024C0C518|nr:Hsp20/alpha crystallin family protein [Halostagnicola sp. A-GB9-2]MDJ1431593.1 Hsp20/alpha crystallin family protein [Halostagnicola sp. A-GB9-2]
MNSEQFTSDQLARKYEYEDGSVIAIDLGTSVPEPSVDLVDGTVIIVSGDEQYEFDLPVEENDADTFIRNGVLTIELEDNV